MTTKKLVNYANNHAPDGSASAMPSQSKGWLESWWDSTDAANNDDYPDPDGAPPLASALMVPEPVRQSRRDEINGILAASGPGAFPPIDYTDGEHKRWTTHALSLLRHREVMCDSALQGWDRLGSLLTSGVPQASHLSDQIRRLSGWELEPVSGLISPEEFFTLLLNKRFPCSLWLRVPSLASFSPDPDMIHEVMGHAVQLVDPKMGEIYQRMAAKFLDAPHAVRPFLGRFWWYVTEVGVLTGDGKRKVIGGAVLSSVKELEMVKTALLWDFDPKRMACTAYDECAPKPWGVYYGAYSLDQIALAIDSL